MTENFCDIKHQSISESMNNKNKLNFRNIPSLGTDNRAENIAQYSTSYWYYNNTCVSYSTGEDDVGTF